jgi:hypothetical protein
MNILTPDERERIVDCSLAIQSVRDSLNRIADEKLPPLKEMRECLKMADESLRDALGYFGATREPRALY